MYTIGATGTYRHSMDYFRNRSWMDNPKKRGMLGPTDEYYAGVNAFLDYAYDHPSHVSEGKIRCPCKSCKLGTYLNRDQVSLHLLSKGFWARYNGGWWAHGEVRIPLAAQVPRNEDNSVYRMNEMIHDAAGPSFDSEERREKRGTYNSRCGSVLWHVTEESRAIMEWMHEA